MGIGGEGMQRGEVRGREGSTSGYIVPMPCVELMFTSSYHTC